MCRHLYDPRQKEMLKTRKGPPSWFLELRKLQGRDSPQASFGFDTSSQSAWLRQDSGRIITTENVYVKGEVVVASWDEEPGIERTLDISVSAWTALPAKPGEENQKQGAAAPGTRSAKTLFKTATASGHAVDVLEKARAERGGRRERMMRRRT
eukprot:7199770-Pyramimonas_sp.AAC.1